MTRGNAPSTGSAREVFLAFLRLGCTSFGGPIAHLGYFRNEFVERRKWLTEEAFAEVVALAQSMPGPASSQVGFALGLLRARWAGGLAAWVGFTTPSAILMLAFAFAHKSLSGKAGLAVVHGLQLVAVAVVAQAIVAMQRSLAPDRQRMALAIIATGIVLFGPAAYGTVLAIAVGALVGGFLLRPDAVESVRTIRLGISRSAGAAAGAAFLILLVVPPFLARIAGFKTLSAFDAFYRTGALVFGGGHVVLPLLENAVVAKGWVDQQTFLSGYGAAQAIPGPLFTFAAYLGAAIRPSAHPLLLGVLALVSIFLPGLLIMIAVLPFWTALREKRQIQACLRGVNASVVGVLIAAFFEPVWTSAVHTRVDFFIALVAFALLTLWKVPSWIIVLGVAFSSWVIAVLTA
jgi:chromate transporter